MTNAQIDLQTAVKALNEQKLKGSAASFIESIKDYSKQELKKLSQKQYKFLRDIAKQNS